MWSTQTQDPKPITNAEFHLKTARFVAMTGLPFAFVETEGFRNYILDLFGEAYMKRCKLTWPSAKVIATRIEQLYEKDKETVIAHLKAASYVCTTSDIWTGFHRGFLGVTAHWIDGESLERRSATLAFR